MALWPCCLDTNDEDCEDCGRPRSRQWCSTCEKEGFKQGFSKWTSGNTDLDQIIRQTQLDANGNKGYIEWIPFKEFANIKYLSRSAFSSMYTAVWIDGPRNIWDEEGNEWIRSGPTKCVLKAIDIDMYMSDKESVLKHLRCVQGDSMADCLGISRDPNGCYLFVMKFYKENLYSHLKKPKKYLLWRDIVNMLLEIVNGLKQIHDNKFYHGSLHCGNLLIEHTIDGIHVRISDCRPINETNSVIHGVLPYIAPEVLRGGEYTQASDIYSFGMIMWTLSTCMRPFSQISHDVNLAKRICDGLRPENNYNTPDVYLALMERCWHQIPEHRPKITELSNILSGWIAAINDYPTSTISMQLNGFNRVKSEQRLFIHKPIHPQAVYTSRLLGFTSLNDNAECGGGGNRLRSFTL